MEEDAVSFLTGRIRSYKYNGQLGIMVLLISVRIYDQKAIGRVFSFLQIE